MKMDEKNKRMWGKSKWHNIYYCVDLRERIYCRKWRALFDDLLMDSAP
jgi:hypothetical protein